MSDLIKKQFNNFLGLDLKSSDINRSDDYSSTMRNAQYQKDGDIEKRKGYKANAESKGGFGLFNYDRISPTDGSVNPELLSVNTDLHKRVTSTLNVTYTGSDPTCLLSVFFDITTDEYKCQILEGTSLVLDVGIDKGFDEASPATLESLRVLIDALADFTATITGVTTIPAAFLDVIRTHDLTVSALALDAGGWEKVNSTVTDPFLGSETNKADGDYENVSSVQLANIMYLSNGYNEVQKYDGQTVYRAGLPEPAIPTTALVGGGALTGTYRHAIRYVQKDAVLNLVEGAISDDSTPDLTPAAQSIDVTLTNIIAGSGFNTNCGIVAGAQVTVNTITVDDGSGGSHTLKSGDTAYFFDSISAGYVERAITSVAATTITIAGAAVTVSDNSVISNNLRIQVYRNQNGGLFKYLSAEIPNDSFNATQVYNDNVTDANLGIQFIEPLVDRGLPPKGRYLASFNSQLVVGGQIGSEDQINWSDVVNPEYFPIGNNLRLDTDGREKVTGIGQTNEAFAVFKETSIDILGGEIETNNIRREVLTKDVGCVAHASIQEVQGRLFFLSDRGVFSIVSGQLPTEESFRIEPEFKQEGIATSDRFISKRAVGVNHREDQKYILYLPVESTSGGDVESTSASRIFAFDYFRSAWLEWNAMNMAGGAVIHNNSLYFTERRLSGFTSNVDHILYKQMSTDDAFDYMDHDTPIDFSYGSNWIHLGEPSVFKHLIRLKVHALTSTKNNSFDLTVKGEKDFIDDFTIFNFPLDLTGSALGYGISAYGVAPYGDISKQSAKHKINKKFQSIRLKFENNVGQENVNITGYELDFATPYKLEIKD